MVTLFPGLSHYREPWHAAPPSYISEFLHLPPWPHGLSTWTYLLHLVSAQAHAGPKYLYILEKYMHCRVFKEQSGLGIGVTQASSILLENMGITCLSPDQNYRLCVPLSLKHGWTMLGTMFSPTSSIAMLNQFPGNWTPCWPFHVPSISSPQPANKKDAILIPILHLRKLAADQWSPGRQIFASGLPSRLVPRAHFSEPGIHRVFWHFTGL